jgi:hypothetical protein
MDTEGSRIPNIAIETKFGLDGKFEKPKDQRSFFSNIRQSQRECKLCHMGYGIVKQ